MLHFTIHVVLRKVFQCFFLKFLMYLLLTDRDHVYIDVIIKLTLCKWLMQMYYNHARIHKRYCVYMEFDQ